MTTTSQPQTQETPVNVTTHPARRTASFRGSHSMTSARPIPAVTLLLRPVIEDSQHVLSGSKPSAGTMHTARS
jgi:hypothetical protein